MSRPAGRAGRVKPGPQGGGVSGDDGVDVDVPRDVLARTLQALQRRSSVSRSAPLPVHPCLAAHPCCIGVSSVCPSESHRGTA